MAEKYETEPRYLIKGTDTVKGIAPEVQARINELRASGFQFGCDRKELDDESSSFRMPRIVKDHSGQIH